MSNPIGNGSQSTVSRLSTVRDYLRGTLWPIPAFMVVVAIGGALALIELDRSLGKTVGFGGNADSARAVLSTIAASMITFTGLVFSITMVALQLASGQYSPRVMRTFLRDRVSKAAMAIFVATFIFAVFVLRATREDFIPGVSINVAILMVLLSVAMFIAYISHIARSIRISSITAAVGSETLELIQNIFPDSYEQAREQSDAGRHQAPQGESGATPSQTIGASDSGVVMSFDGQALAGAAEECDVVLELIPAVGDFLPSGAPLLIVHGGSIENTERLTAFVHFGVERSMQQDVAFGIRQLVDIAIRALSPGVNDPTTAVQSIDQIHGCLRAILGRSVPPGLITDERGNVRLDFHALGWGDFVSLAFDEIRLQANGSSQALRRLHSALSDLVEAAPEPRKGPLLEQLEALAETIDRTMPSDRDRKLAAAADVRGML